MIGSTLGNYRITQKLGQGGVGEVWRALDLSLDRDVALKILRPELAAMPDLVARFRTEALALARLNHPNVATIHGFHTEGGATFIVMEHIAGQTLEALVRSFGPMRCARALPLFAQVLDAIGHAHEHGLVHRDLKASNVMITHSGAVKMLDFGIARVAGSPHLTKDTHSIGTPAWMAPEQVRGEEADVRTDVYALGLLLYWLLTTRLPFAAKSHYELERAHVEKAPPPPRQFAPDIPEAVENAILRALAKHPGERFASVGELRAALGEAFAPMAHAALEETVAYASTPPPGPTLVLPRDDAPKPRRRLAMAACAAALLAVAAFFAVRALRTPAPAPPAPALAAQVAPAPLAAAPAPIVTAPAAPQAETKPASEPAAKPKRTARTARSKRATAGAEQPPANQSEDGWVIRRQ